MILVNNVVLYFNNLEVYSLHSMKKFIAIILLSLNLYSNSNTSDFLIKQNNVLPANKAFNIETTIGDDDNGIVVTALFSGGSSIVRS